MPNVLALDQGTTSSRAIVFDRGGYVLHVAQKEFQQIFPRAGWVENDPQEIWASQRDVAARVLKESVGARGAGDIAAICNPKQWETTVVWGRDLVQPITNALV